MSVFIYVYGAPPWSLPFLIMGTIYVTFCRQNFSENEFALKREEFAPAGGRIYRRKHFPFQKNFRNENDIVVCLQACRNLPLVQFVSPSL